MRVESVHRPADQGTLLLAAANRASGCMRAHAHRAQRHDDHLKCHSKSRSGLQMGTIRPMAAESYGAVMTAILINCSWISVKLGSRIIVERVPRDRILRARPSGSPNCTRWVHDHLAIATRAAASQNL
jgi:hypothetical protein